MLSVKIFKKSSSAQRHLGDRSISSLCDMQVSIYLSQLHHEKYLTILYLLVLAVQLSVKECRQKMKTDLLSRWSSTKTTAVGNKEF